MKKATPASSPQRFGQFLRLLHDHANDEVNGGQDTKGQRTRIEIKIAAAKLLEKHGYDGFALTDVAVQTQISRPAVYQYYANKQALVLELLSDFQLFMSQTLSQSSTPPARSDEQGRLQSINLAYVRFFAANAQVLVSIQQVRRSLSDAAKLQLDFNDSWAQKIARSLLPTHAQTGLQAQEVALLQAYALEHMVDGLLTDIYVSKNPKLKRFAAQPELVAQIITAMWLKIINKAS
jgi:TetR/AcrR family transcriptional regulator, ethionamide resistance regulator